MRGGLLGLLSGELPQGNATAVTWVPDDVVRGIVSAEGDAALSEFAKWLGVDGALVPAGAPAAAAHVRLYHDAGIEVIWAVDGLLGRVASQVGWPEALKISEKDPSQFARLVDDALEAVGEDVRRGHAAGAGVLLLADDLAGSDGWLVSPGTATVLVERLAQTLSHWPGCGAVFHSDGDVREVLPLVARSGFSAVHFGVFGAELLEASFDAAWASGLCPMGGIPVASAAGPGRLERLIELARKGPCVLADDGGIASTADARRLKDAVATLQFGMPESVSRKVLPEPTSP